MTTPPTPPYDPFVLPDAGTVQFLATTVDPREGKEGTVYGIGHKTTYDATDLDFIRQCYLDGKIALIDPLPPVVEFEQPTDYPPPEQQARRKQEQQRQGQAQEQPKQPEQPRREQEQPRRR